MKDTTSMFHKAKWRNRNGLGKRTVTGRWSYYPPSDTFDIILDQLDRTTGQSKKLSLKGCDKPEWGSWKLVEEDS